MVKFIPYTISNRAIIVSLYLFAFLFLALYGNEGFQTINQIILWVFGPLLAIFIIEPNISKLGTIPKEYYFYLSMVGFAFLGYVNVINEEFFYRYLQVFLANFVLMVIVYFAINNIREWELAWKIIAMVGLLVSVMGYFKGAQAMDEEYFRLTGLTGNANGTANYARVAIIAFLIVLQFARKKFWKIFIWVSILYLSYTIILTASRGGFANLIFILGGYVVFKYFSGWRLILLLVLLFLFGNLVLYFAEEFLQGFYLFERLTRNDSVSGAVENEARLKLYTLAWNLFLEHPFVGVGLNQFRIYSKGPITHTDLLDIFVQLGIFAGIIYASIYIKLAGRIRKLKSWLRDKRDLQIYHILLLGFASEVLYGISNPNWFTQLQMVVLSLFIIYSFKIRSTRIAYPVKFSSK